MKRVANFMLRKWSWARQNKLFWANIGLGFITYGLIVKWPSPVVSETPSDFRLRAWGMFLQLLGAWTVWRDLTGTARELGAAGILRRNWVWLKAGLGFQTVVALGANLTSTASMSGGRVTVRPTIDRSALLEQRITVLENYVEYVDRDVSAAFHEMAIKDRDLRRKMDEDAKTLHGVISSTEARLRNAMVGSYSVLLFGAFWLFVGIVLSSVAPEIAKIVAGQFKAVWDAA
jgi:hypothetical protein